MTCILLTEMDPPTTSSMELDNGLFPANDEAPRPDPKQDMDAACLTVNLYYCVDGRGGCGAKGSESVLTFPSGVYVAEELCISAAKACGESQVDFRAHVCSNPFHHSSGLFCNIVKFSFLLCFFFFYLIVQLISGV